MAVGAVQAPLVNGIGQVDLGGIETSFQAFELDHQSGGVDRRHWFGPCRKEGIDSFCHHFDRYGDLSVNHL